MSNDSALILAFSEGPILIGSPCILPILPIVLSGSLQSQSNTKPLGIALGFFSTFTLFTYFSRFIIQYSGIDVDIIRYVAQGLILLFGLIMTSNYLTKQFSFLTQGFANIGALGSKHYSRFELINGFVLGALIGFVWTPCAGPIFASIILQTILEPNSIHAFWLILCFSLGVSTPLLLISLLGKNIMHRSHFWRSHWVFVRKTLGLTLILSVIYLAYGPISFNFDNKVPNKATHLINGVLIPYPLPKIEGIENWFNSPALTNNDLKNKVVLIDFWTYSCINCVRTLPYLKEWYQKYHDKGLEIIGIHTPEFAFEGKVNNVLMAIKKQAIPYPVAMDNQWVTWQNFSNHYWPAHYLINERGLVVYTHFGEGAYDITENNIRFLLHLDKDAIKNAQSETPQTLEFYLGYERMAPIANNESFSYNQTVLFTYPQDILLSSFALNGLWQIQSERIIAKAEKSALKIHVHGKKVYAVMGSLLKKPISVMVRFHDRHNQVMQKTITISDQELYTVVEFNTVQDGTLELIAKTPELAIYTILFD